MYTMKVQKLLPPQTREVSAPIRRDFRLGHDILNKFGTCEAKGRYLSGDEIVKRTKQNLMGCYRLRQTIRRSFCCLGSDWDSGVTINY